MTFTGFPDEGFAFYEGLLADNSKAYWQAHRGTYDASVRAPMESLVAALEPEFGPAQLFRPYRDVRFSKDKSPYKTHQGAFATAEDGVGYYVQVSADGLMAAAGFHPAGTDQLARYREAVDEERTGTRLEKIVDKLRASGFDVAGDTLKSRPRGYDADHPRIDLLRHKTFEVWRQWPPEPWVHTATALAEVRQAWRATVPLVDWFARNVGPSREPRRGR